MKHHIHHTNHIHHSLWCLLLLASSLAAADLQITPTVAVVETGETLTLSMTGTDRPVTWKATKGQVQSAVGYQATYTAPLEAGVDSVFVTDDSGNRGTCRIIVVREGTFVPENANWKVFANRRTISGLLLSEDKETLWVATSGGLEQRETKTQRLLRIYTTQQGLPHNFVQTLLADSQGGLWLGTQGGLAYLQKDGQIKKFGGAGFEWATKVINSLTADGQGGLWVTARESGLVHFHADQQTAELFSPSNSKLPDTWTYSPVLDGQGGVWVGTRQGLAHLLADQQQWEVFNTSNSKLPDDRVVRLLADGQGGLWIGTGDNNLDLPVDSGGGLVHRDAQGNWEVFNTSNVPAFPGNIVWSLTSDKQGGVWAGLTNNDFTDQKGGLVHRHPDGTWEVFTPSESTLPHPAVPAILADNREGIWVGTMNGLVYLHNDGTWDTFTPVKEDAPSNIVIALDSDENGGLWIAGGDVAGLGEGGVAHLSAEGVWNSRYNGLAFAVSADGQGGMWIGIAGALVHFPASGKPDEAFSIFDDPKFSKLPGNLAMVMSVLSDGAGGVWIGGYNETGQQGGGLAHLLADRTWELFDTKNSELPDDMTTTLATDNQGGLWIGTLKGLAHLRADKTWEVFTTGNSQLPEDSVMSLASDNQGGVWVGTMMSGIAHLKTDRTWQVFNQGNSKLPRDGVIKTLLADDRDGVWAGILGLDMSNITADSSFTEDVNSLSFDQGGLVHLNPDGKTEIFTTQNSGLPDNQVIALKSDGRGGIWVGTAFGLAYLTLSKKAFLCDNANLDEATCDALLKGKRAAIIIAGGGNDANNKTFWDTTEGIANSIYQMLYERGFENDEIYYLSPKLWADFNHDGVNDRVVDAPQPENPLQVSDVQQAVEWAKGRGKLDQPLYLFFVDHGAEDSNQQVYFKLSSTTPLEVGQFKGFLDEYTTATSSSMVMVIDACWSGALMDGLSPSASRAIISSSTGSGKAYFYAPEKQGFSRFLADSLREGKSFGEAFEDASLEQTNILPRVAESSSEKTDSKLGQDPLFNDGGNSEFRTIFVNGNFPRTNPVSIKELVSSGATDLPAGQKHLFKAQVNVTQGYAQHVWAVLKPPRVNLVLDNNGTPILDLPLLTLSPTVDAGIWEATWRDAVYNGEYELTFYAEDNQGYRASSSPVTVTVTGGTELPAQAEVQVMLTPQQQTYKVGERLTIQLTEQLSWGYDLYAMVTFPDGAFAMLTDTNQFQTSNQAQKWVGKKVPNSPITLMDMTLVDSVGSYCVYGILSPAKEDFLAAETKASQVEVKWCAEVVKE